jgi:hexokinase
LFSSETVEKIRNIFEDEIERGIKSDKSSSLQMENTYIPELPDGTGKVKLNILKFYFVYGLSK